MFTKGHSLGCCFRPGALVARCPRLSRQRTGTVLRIAPRSVCLDARKGGSVKAQGEAAACVLDSDDMRRAVSRIAHEVVERNRGAEGLVLVGIHTRGVPLSARIAEEIAKIEGVRPSQGSVDTAFYRDDVGLPPRVPTGPTSVPVPLSGAHVILVDDVLFTGRSVRAALTAVWDFGRPLSVQLAVLVDRGHRELPIQADYVGRDLATERNETVKVRVTEIDGFDRVDVLSPHRGVLFE